MYFGAGVSGESVSGDGIAAEFGTEEFKRTLVVLVVFKQLRHVILTDVTFVEDDAISKRKRIPLGQSKVAGTSWFTLEVVEPEWVGRDQPVSSRVPGGRMPQVARMVKDRQPDIAALNIGRIVDPFGVLAPDVFAFDTFAIHRLGTLVDAKAGVMHVYQGEKANSEQVTDCLNTEKEFSHFILKMEYKWLEKRFAPRTNWDRDAGLLFHVHGDLKKIWPLCLEMQIGESPGDKPHAREEKGRFHSGDLFVLGEDLRVDTHREKGEANMRDYWKPEPKGGKLVNWRHCPTRLGVEVPKAYDDPEKGWNEMEIRVHGAEKATFILNGEVVLELTNFTQLNEKGERVPLDSGRIGLQAEWAEILYRNIRIKEFDAGEVPELKK